MNVRFTGENNTATSICAGPLVNALRPKLCNKVIPKVKSTNIISLYISSISFKFISGSFRCVSCSCSVAPAGSGSGLHLCLIQGSRRVRVNCVYVSSCVTSGREGWGRGWHIELNSIGRFKSRSSGSEVGGRDSLDSGISTQWFRGTCGFLRSHNYLANGQNDIPVEKHRNYCC